MSDELVQRLRAAANLKMRHEDDRMGLTKEAIKEIERLRAEVADARLAVAYNVTRAERAESTLAALRKRVDEAPKVWWDATARCAMLNTGQAIPPTCEARMVVEE